jgi:thiamine biosynthesis lipoprotein
MTMTTNLDPAQRPWRGSVSRLRVGLGTFIAVEAQASEPALAERAVAAAFEAVQTVDTLMHPNREGSDLAALNRCLPGVPLRVDPWTWQVLELAQQVHRASQGLFDPCWDEAAGRMSDVELCEGSCVVLGAAVHIDLGGIAKGYAVDRALDALRAAGCEGGLVNAGGDLAVFGDQSRQLVYAVRGSRGSSVELRNAALASSDATLQSRTAEHRGYYHGRTRGSVAAGAVTVVAPCAAIADALTKCLLLGDAMSNQSLLERFDARQLV